MHVEHIYLTSNFINMYVTSTKVANHISLIDNYHFIGNCK